MKKFFFLSAQIFSLLFLCAFLNKLHSQDTHITNVDPLQKAFNDVDDRGTVTLISGGRSYNSKSDDDVSSFITPEWTLGNVNFKNGKQLNDVELKFNFVKNELYFKKDNKMYVFINQVKDFTLFDTVNGVVKILKFKTDYPAIENIQSNAFYQVLATGSKIEVLKHFSKKNFEVLPYDSPDKPTYKIDEYLYLYDVKNNKVQPINNTVSSVEKTLPVYASNIQDLMSGQNKHLTESQIISLINNVNNL